MVRRSIIVHHNTRRRNEVGAEGWAIPDKRMREQGFGFGPLQPSLPEKGSNSSDMSTTVAVQINFVVTGRDASVQ